MAIKPPNTITVYVCLVIIIIPPILVCSGIAGKIVPEGHFFALCFIWCLAVGAIFGSFFGRSSGYSEGYEDARDEGRKQWQYNKELLEYLEDDLAQHIEGEEFRDAVEELIERSKCMDKFFAFLKD